MKTNLQKTKNYKEREKFKQKDPAERQFPSDRAPALLRTPFFNLKQNLATDRELKPFFLGYDSCRNKLNCECFFPCVATES